MSYFRVAGRQACEPACGTARRLGGLAARVEMVRREVSDHPHDCSSAGATSTIHLARMMLAGWQRVARASMSHSKQAEVPPVPGFGDRDMLTTGDLHLRRPPAHFAPAQRLITERLPDVPCFRIWHHRRGLDVGLRSVTVECEMWRRFQRTWPFLTLRLATARSLEAALASTSCSWAASSERRCSASMRTSLGSL